MFKKNTTGILVPISGTDPRGGEWQHQAFVPNLLADISPTLTAATYREVANARAALAALDSTAKQLPNPALLRRPTLRREAQSTSALEGTYAPLSDVLTADDEAPQNPNIREILNYVVMADYAFGWVGDGRDFTASMFADLQGMLVRGTASEGPGSGDLRTDQVVIGRRSDANPAELPVKAARFIPPPAGADLRARFQDLVTWMRADHSQEIDPVVAAAMAHYQFETLHPFHDGNGRIGRLLVVLQLHKAHILSEPTLTVSPWFEGRRTEYYDRLLAVSTEGDWDRWVHFFATGIMESARLTHRQMLGLVSAQETLKEMVRASNLRADSAQVLVDYAVAHPSFTVRRVQRDMGISYGRANNLVGQLTEIGVLSPLGDNTYNRRFHAPAVMDVLLNIE